MVLRYHVESEDTPSLPLPVSCQLTSGSQVQSTVTCSGFLEPGCYAVLPLAFNHWDLSSGGDRALSGAGLAGSPGDTNSRGCVLALHSNKNIQYREAAMTRPGFLAESIFLLAARARPKSTVGKSTVSLIVHSMQGGFPPSMPWFFKFRLARSSKLNTRCGVLVDCKLWL